MILNFLAREEDQRMERLGGGVYFMDDSMETTWLIQYSKFFHRDGIRIFLAEELDADSLARRIGGLDRTWSSAK